jgi:hypothetical protein
MQPINGGNKDKGNMHGSEDRYLCLSKRVGEEQIVAQLYSRHAFGASRRMRKPDRERASVMQYTLGQPTRAGPSVRGLFH